MKEEKISTAYGTASLITGSIGAFPVIWFMPYFGIVFSALAIVFAILQNRQTKLTRSTTGLILVVHQTPDVFA